MAVYLLPGKGFIEIDAETGVWLAPGAVYLELQGGGGGPSGPTLTSPTGTETGTTSASGTVTTDTAGGTLYYLASTNASEDEADVLAGSSQAVSGSGVQNVTISSGLSPATLYYLHYLQLDGDSPPNVSNVASSAGFTTDSDIAPDDVRGALVTLVNPFAPAGYGVRR